MESSHDIVESLCYIPHYCSHMGTTEIAWNSDAAMVPEKTDITKNVLLMHEWNAFWCIVFERWVGQ